MKILHVGASLSRLAGGVAPALWELAKYQQKAGVDVEVVGLEDAFSATDTLPYSTIPSTRVPQELPNPFGYAFKLQQVVSKVSEKADLIHSHGVWMYPGITAWRAAQRRETPLVITPHGMLEPWAIKNNWWKKKIPWVVFQRKILKQARVIHATSIQEAENLRKLDLSNPIAVVPNAIEIPQEKDSNHTEKTIFTALFLSRIHKKKGLINLIKAWDIARPENWHLLIAGPDEDGHLAEVKKEVATLGLNDQIEFIGPITNEKKWDLYRSVDLFVLPTFSENFGIVIAEALACEIPVITTKGAPWVELEEHKCGWWIDIGIEPLIKALQEATRLTEKTRCEMGKRGRDLIIQKYSWDTIAQDMISVYEWILHGGTPPQCVIID